MNAPSNLKIFTEHRDALFGIAYRMLGTRADAEDIVQNAWLRWNQHADNVDYPTSWLRQTTTRLAIDSAKRAYRRRETYVGPWLPEPLYDASNRALQIPGAPPNPEQSLLMEESIRLGFLQCLEQLSPLERAAYLLRHVYGLDYNELAAALERSEPAVRKLVSRASQKMDGSRTRAAERGHTLELITRFLSALGANDVDAMTRILLHDVTATTDSDGKRTAARRPIVGQKRVLAFLRGLAEKQDSDWAVEFIDSNGDIALKITAGDVLQSVIVPLVQDDGIREFLIYRNPEKLPQ